MRSLRVACDRKQVLRQRYKLGLGYTAHEACGCDAQVVHLEWFVEDESTEQACTRPDVVVAESRH
jgi:hypothetical protein